MRIGGNPRTVLLSQEGYRLDLQAKLKRGGNRLVAPVSDWRWPSPGHGSLGSC